MEGPRGDPGGGESVIVADSTNASLLSSLSCWFCFFFVLLFGGRLLPLGFGVTNTDDAAALDAAALDSAAADANRVSFFLGTFLQINCPILLLLLLLLLLLVYYYYYYSIEGLIT
jgi:hypothetical protein